MKYQLNNKGYIHYDNTSTIKPLDLGVPLVVAFDPSKTNMGMTIGSTSGEILALYDISGKGMDTTDYVIELETFLDKLLSKSDIVAMGQEAAILKTGNSYYHSMQVLQEIRAKLLDIIKRKFNLEPILVNNWKWKGKILTPEYRKKNLKRKGSWLMLSNANPLWADYSDDVTDAVCIYFYITKYVLEDVEIFCNKSEKMMYPPKYVFLDETLIPRNAIEFKYNYTYDLMENIAFFTNRKQSQGFAKIKVTPRLLPYMYRNSLNLHMNSTVCILTSRK